MEEDKKKSFIQKHKYKCILSLLLCYHFLFPRWQGCSWIYYYYYGSKIYGQSNPTKSSDMLITLKNEWIELIEASSMSEWIDEFFDVFHVILLYIMTIIKIPLLRYLIPSLARVAAIKCAKRYHDHGCIRSLRNCTKKDHLCKNTLLKY